MSWLTALFPETKIGAEPVARLVKELTDRDQNVRRRATDRLIRSLRGAEHDAATGRAVRKLIDGLVAARPGVQAALKQKRRRGDTQMYLHVVPPRKGKADPLHTELDTLLNALEYDFQRHAPTDVRCPHCGEVIHTSAGASSVKCGGCAEPVPVVRWLYSSRGKPVAFVVDEFVYRSDGAYLGNLEGNQVFEFDYKGEIVFDDRLMHDRSKDARHRHGWHHIGPPLAEVPPPPPAKPPLDPGQVLGGPAELKHFSDDF